MSWATPQPRWDTVAGRLLDSFFSLVSETLPDYAPPLTLFGSAAIQLCLDEHFTSADVDLMAVTGGETLRKIAGRAGLGRSGSVRLRYGIQICPPQLFRTTPHYQQRAWTGTRHGIAVIVPHVRDVLLAKLHRSRHEGQAGLVPKDRQAFFRVRELCDNRPDEEDVLEDLRLCEPDLRIPHDGSVNAFHLNAIDLFREVFGRSLDMEKDILAPARAAEEADRTADGTDLGELLRDLQPDRD